jgi:hypothetical protein
MKRTRQVFHYDEDKVPTDISGCRMFHGEDLRKLLLKESLLYRKKNQYFHLNFHDFWWYAHNNFATAFNDRMKYQAETQK